MTLPALHNACAVECSCWILRQGTGQATGAGRDIFRRKRDLALNSPRRQRTKAWFKDSGQSKATRQVTRYRGLIDKSRSWENSKFVKIKSFGGTLKGRRQCRKN